MAVGIYMDVHRSAPITHGLRRRGVSVLTAQEDGTRKLLDSDLLTRASSLQMLLYTHDTDFLSEAKRRAEDQAYFFGIIFSNQPRLRIGKSNVDFFLFFFAVSLRTLRLCVKKTCFTQSRQVRKGRKARKELYRVIRDQLNSPVGQCIEDIEMIAKVLDPTNPAVESNTYRSNSTYQLKSCFTTYF